MAIEIKKGATLAEIKEIANSLLDKADAAEKVEDRQAIEADLEEVINTYTAESKRICYAAAQASGDPMKFAVTEFFFPTIKLTQRADKDNPDLVIREIVDAEKPIDLTDLHKKIRGGIGADKNWFFGIQRLNYYLTVRAADRVGATVKSDAMVMDEIARAIDLGKNPCSNTQMLKTLQTIVTMMLGEGYNATSHDVNYLVDVYANDTKKSKTAITLANHKTLVGYLKKVCRRILTGAAGYDAVQKEIKEEDKK